MISLLPGVLDGEDIECLHDYRVALRRSRSVLSALEDFERHHGLRKWRHFFRRLARITTPVRDLDVLLAADPSPLPDPVYASFSLQEYLTQRRHVAHEQLCAYLQGEDYAQQLHEWRAFLEQSSLDSCLKGKLCPQRFYSRTLQLAMKRVQKGAAQLDPQAAAGHYHELRKACKVLRYRLEMLDTYEQAPRLIKRLKKLQDLLGAFQDEMVRLAYLQDYYRACHILTPPLTATVPCDYIEQRGKKIRKAVRSFLMGPGSELYQQLVEDLQSG